MRFTHIHLENWRNFVSVDVDLPLRVFLVGPNAAGKSNFLDALRFLRDLAEGGLQRAIQEQRGGVSKIRSLHARRYSDICIDVKARIGTDPLEWRYRIVFSQDNQRRPQVKEELVQHGPETVCKRPLSTDDKDKELLTQTHLEQVSENKRFRDLADFFSKVRYLHVIPQLVREPNRYQIHGQDPYGSDFLEQVARTQKRTRESRLRKIEVALRLAVPNLKDLKLERDETSGIPHLHGMYEHWRPKSGWQREDQFSDGTLRLIGLLWAFLDGRAPLLLEEPELSLHPAVARLIPAMMARVSRKNPRQMFVSTHSPDLLSGEGIAPEEVLLLIPSHEATEVSPASSDEQVVTLLNAGLPMADAVIPLTAPKNAAQLSLFDS